MPRSIWLNRLRASSPLELNASTAASPIEQRVGVICLPKRAQLADPLGRRVPGDDCSVDGADRNAGDPIGMQVSFGERFVNAGLIGAERAAALQQQSDALKRRTLVRHCTVGPACIRLRLARCDVPECGVVKHTYVPFPVLRFRDCLESKELVVRRSAAVTVEAIL